jgi:hypothetical protein
MKKLVVEFDDKVPVAFGDPTTRYVTEDRMAYVLGSGLSPDHIQRVRGGIEMGGQTYLHVKR